MLTVRELKWAAIAKAHGMKNVVRALEEARLAGIGPALAFAMLEQETGDGSNVFGHDRDQFGKLIFPAQSGTVKVTEALYKEYKKRRIASGNRRMQGVGPLQLTFWTTQDEADRQGGCWKPRINIRTGFMILSRNINAHGMRDGIRRYNGSGPAAERYADSVLVKRAKWRKRLGIR